MWLIHGLVLLSRLRVGGKGKGLGVWVLVLWLCCLVWKLVRWMAGAGRNCTIVHVLSKGTYARLSLLVYSPNKRLSTDPS